MKCGQLSTGQSDAPFDHQVGVVEVYDICGNDCNHRYHLDMEGNYLK